MKYNFLMYRFLFFCPNLKHVPRKQTKNHKIEPFLMLVEDSRNTGYKVNTVLLTDVERWLVTTVFFTSKK